MPAIAIIATLKEFKKEIFWLVVLILGIVAYYKFKSYTEDKKNADKVKAVVDGSNAQDKAIAESLGVEQARVAVLRGIAQRTAYALGTLPTLAWYQKGTEDEESVIFQLNKAETATEILTIAEFYEEITASSLAIDLNLLSSSDRNRINFYASL